MLLQRLLDSICSIGDLSKLKEFTAKTKVVPAKENLAVGRSYFFTRYRQKNDPFSLEERYTSTATVLELKDGWVRYKIGDGHLYPDERMKASDFVKNYSIPVP